jgi:hypothetical protein
MNLYSQVMLECRSGNPMQKVKHTCLGIAASFGSMALLLAMAFVLTSHPSTSLRATSLRANTNVEQNASVLDLPLCKQDADGAIVLENGCIYRREAYDIPDPVTIRIPYLAREYEGQVDGCTLASVSGWVLHNKQGTSITVAVNGKTLSTNVSADMPRPDVARLTKGTENSGFDFKFPAPVVAGDRVQVKFANGEIVGGPQGPSCTVE